MWIELAVVVRCAGCEAKAPATMHADIQSERIDGNSVIVVQRVEAPRDWFVYSLDRLAFCGVCLEAPGHSYEKSLRDAANKLDGMPR